MSGNQSRGDKSKPQHYRRTGRSGNPASPRNFTGGGKGSGGGGGGGGGAAAPSSSAFYSGKSFKKMVSNAQGAQARGTSDASSTGSTIKATDTFIQKSTPGLPKAPQSNAVPLGSGATGPSTSVKGLADAPKVFSLQFGSISPGVINGMQVPALTNPAPPNLDEQKWAQIDGQSSSVSSSSVGVQDTANKNVSETSNKVEEPSIVVDLSASPCDNVEKWNKGSGGAMDPGWDPRHEIGYPAIGNHGVLSAPRGQPPGQYPGGILSGAMQSPCPQIQRNNSDSERWQHATGYQKGLMPSPHTPMMHTAEMKYEVGKVTNEEQAKQRRFKSILYQLTPQNFEKLFDQVTQLIIDNADTLSGVVGQIFDKALMEPTFAEMYANFCSRLAVELPGFGDDNEKITFKRLLLNKCQEEFERGEREEEEANGTEEGDIKQTEEEREEKRIKARRRMLGNIRLIGELYKKRMLTERIMHECIKKLLGFNQKNHPDEEAIEALCKLMSTIGEMIDHPKAKEHMDAYFDMMFKLSNNMTLSSRVRFMLKHTIDLRRNKWQQRRKVDGPKKIEEVHRDAAQESLVQSSRLTCGPSSNASLRRGAGVLSSNSQMSGSFRGLPQQQLRG